MVIFHSYVNVYQRVAPAVGSSGHSRWGRGLGRYCNSAPGKMGCSDEGRCQRFEGQFGRIFNELLVGRIFNELVGWKNVQWTWHQFLKISRFFTVFVLVKAWKELCSCRGGVLTSLYFFVPKQLPSICTKHMYQITSDEKDSLCFCDVSHLALPDAQRMQIAFLRRSPESGRRHCAATGGGFVEPKASFLSRDKMVIAPPTRIYIYNYIYIYIHILHNLLNSPLQKHGEGRDFATIVGRHWRGDGVHIESMAANPLAPPGVLRRAAQCAVASIYVDDSLGDDTIQ